MRRSLYLRETLDGDILQVVKPLLKKQSFAHVMRELARDGIKYREMMKNGRNVTQSNTSTKPYKPQVEEVKYDNRTQSKPFTPTNQTKPLSNVKITKKEVANKELESRLDSF